MKELNETEKFALTVLSTMSEKIKKGKCTNKEMDALAKVLSSEMCCLTSVSDFVDVVNKDKEDNEKLNPTHIHSAISRNRFGKKLRPIREYLYNIKELFGVLPNKYK